jgi:hypothetical protein
MNKKGGIDDFIRFIKHLERIEFSGTVLGVFNKGKLTAVSRKEEYDPVSLSDFMRRPVIIKKRDKDATREGNEGNGDADRDNTSELVPNSTAI